jgi:hypothetical protein
MKKLFSMAALAAVTTLLAACGGDAFQGASTGDSTGGGGGNTTTSTVASLTVTTSTATIPSDGSASATITVVAKDKNSAAVTGATIGFSASSGNITAGSSTTDTTGTVTATLAAGSAAAGATITVTATSGSVTGQTTVTVTDSKQTVALQTSAPQLPSDNSAPATITALVRDANNNFVSGVTVAFTADSGGLAVTQGVTDTTGAATAVLTTPNDPSSRTITVTAKAGTATSTIGIPVVGTSLSVSGPTSLALGATGDYNVSLTNFAHVGIPNTVVTVSSTAGTPSATTVTTDSSGHAIFHVPAATAGSQTVSVVAEGLNGGQGVTVSSQSFAFTAPASTADSPANVNLGTSQLLTLVWANAGAPVLNQPVNFAATRGTLTFATVNTDNSSGTATVNIASTQSGPSVVTATAGTGVNAVQTSINLDFLATTPAALDAQASPSTIAITGQSTITATVRDAANNLVQNKTVNFALSDNTGGSLSVGSALTDVNGQASTVYTASKTPSASGGVVVTAQVQGTNISDSTSLTVGGQTVFLSLGTGVNISEDSTKTTFIMPWTVKAVDSGGNPVDNIKVTLALHSAYYEKGTWQDTGSKWAFLASAVPTPPATAPVGGYTIAFPGCKNEDLNLNGVLDPGEDTTGTGNNNGKLDPGDVAIAPGNVTTTTTAAVGSAPATHGTATFNVEYPEDHAMWVTSTLTATASVQGTQATTSATFQLPMVNTYTTSDQSAIPGFQSPYGIANTCTNPN